jgi:hypothetical protein
VALHAGPDEVLDEIARQRQRARAPAKREALRRLRAYVGERVVMMDCPACRAKGWDIGSGPTEAQCKTMTARLKGSGMRWNPANAEALLALSGVADSEEWSAYWRSQGAQWNWSHPVRTLRCAGRASPAASRTGPMRQRCSVGECRRDSRCLSSFAGALRPRFQDARNASTISRLRLAEPAAKSPNRVQLLRLR